MKLFCKLMVLILLTGTIALAEEEEWCHFRIEALFLEPLFTQTAYAQQFTDTTFPANRRFNNVFDFHWAYRLFGSVSLPCAPELQLIWTHLPKSCHTSSHTGPIVTVPNIEIGGIFASASSRITTQYMAFDTLLACWVPQCSLFDFKFNSGLHVANFLYNERLSYRGITPNEDLKNRCHTWGIGPEIAVNTSFPFTFLGCPKLAFVSDLKGSLLASHYTANFKRISGVMATQPASREKFWNMIVMWGMRLGLNYSYRFGCFTSSLEFGYEMLSYRNVIEKVLFSGTGNAAGLSNNLFSDASFHGPYLALDIGF